MFKWSTNNYFILPKNQMTDSREKLREKYHSAIQLHRDFQHIYRMVQSHSTQSFLQPQ